MYEFDEYLLDPLRRVLSPRADGQPLQVTGRVFDTLLYFVEHEGQLLDKRTLMEAVWGDFVVEESNLTQTIHTLRRVLGERPGEHRIIVTVPSRGYRFVAPVTTRTTFAPPATATERPPEASPAPRHTRKTLAMAALSLAVLGVSVFIFPWPREMRGRLAGTSAPSIAVLPFVDMSPEQDQEYLGDGLSEEILNLLGQSGRLRVIARTSSFSFKGAKADIAAIAEKLTVSQVPGTTCRRSD